MSTVRLSCSVGSLPVLSGSLVLPVRGNWSATVVLHASSAPLEGEPASLVFTREDGSTDTFTGTVRHAEVSAGSVALSVTLVGGAGRLLATLPPRDHAPGVTEIPAGLVAKGIADDAGEALAATVETALDAAKVHRWTRIALPARDALDLLVDALGWGWRVLADGTVWAGAETWPEATATKYLSAIPDDAGDLYACDGAPIRPGTTLGGRKLVEVVYAIAPGGSRVTVRASVSGDPPPTRDGAELYARTYVATVHEQASDGALVVACDDARLGVLRGVPLRCGIPGARITYTTPAGERVRVAFEGADPRGVYALPAHDQVAAAATVHGVAREGDRVGYLIAETSGSPPVMVSLWWSPTPSPGAQWTKIGAIFGKDPSNFDAGTALIITTGSAEVQLR